MSRTDKNNKTKYTTVKQLREWGLLFEINRQVLHPLGLALAVEVDNDGNEIISPNIWDCRDDPEGVLFGDDLFADGRRKARKMMEDWGTDKLQDRLGVLGYIVQDNRPMTNNPT